MNELPYWMYMSSASHHPQGMDKSAQDVDSVIPGLCAPDPALDPDLYGAMMEIFKDILLDYKDFIDSDPEIRRQFQMYQAEKQLKS